jgi:hypothetical protein
MGTTATFKEELMKDVLVVIGAGSTGVAIARRVGCLRFLPHQVRRKLRLPSTPPIPPDQRYDDVTSTTSDIPRKRKSAITFDSTQQLIQSLYAKLFTDHVYK